MTQNVTKVGGTEINNNSYLIQENSVSYREFKNTRCNFIFNVFSKQWNTKLKYLNICFVSCSLLWFVLTLLIFFRIIQSNHFPLANFYEALIFLTWCLVSLNFLILLTYTGKTNSINSKASRNVLAFLPFFQRSYEEQSVQKQVSGAVLAPCILFIIAFAQFHLSSDITPLVPALKSNWLLMHVSIMICSYTTFIIGGLLSVILLMQIFSGNIIEFFKKFKLWNKNQVALWFPKTNLKLGWSSLSPLSVSNNIAAKDFLKMQNENVFSERVFQPSFLDALNKKDVNCLKDTLKQENLKRRWPLGFFKPVKPHRFAQLNKTVDHRFLSIPSDETQKKGDPILNVQNREFETTVFKNNTLWQQNAELNQGFPSFPYVLTGPVKMQKKNFYIILDNLSYRMMGIGFPLFTLGILSGAVWANEAWGSYWSWDIKEVGSFINWLLVALYFHCRYKNFISFSHIVAFISLMVLFFNFFGISLGIFGSSLHAYGASS